MGGLASVRLILHALAARGLVKVAWLFLAALVVGTATWTTHFVAMLAYLARTPVSYDPTLTIASLLVAIAGAGLALSVAAASDRGALPAIGGGLLGLAIATMHYIGMLAYGVDRIVTWHAGFVAASLLLAAVFGALSLAAVRGQIRGRVGVYAAPALLVAATLTLHFTGMVALEITPPDFSHPVLGRGAPALALATALAALLIFSAAGFAYLIDARTSREARERIAKIASASPCFRSMPRRRTRCCEKRRQRSRAPWRIPWCRLRCMTRTPVSRRGKDRQYSLDRPLGIIHRLRGSDDVARPLPRRGQRITVAVASARPA